MSTNSYIMGLVDSLRDELKWGLEHKRITQTTFKRLDKQLIRICNRMTDIKW